MIAIMIMVVLVIYLSFVFTVSKWVYKKPEKVSSKWLASIGTAVFLLFVPMADNIVGEVYFKYLCATQGGIKVYQTVKLSNEYWNKYGTPIFIDSKGNIDTNILMDFNFTRENDSDFITIFRIKKELYQVGYKESGSVLGERVIFFYYGGWLVNSTGMHVMGSHCPSNKDISLANLMNDIFIKEN